MRNHSRRESGLNLHELLFACALFAFILLFAAYQVWAAGWLGGIQVLGVLAGVLVLGAVVGRVMNWWDERRRR